MPATLIDSQFADLERPGPDELSISLDATRPIPEILTKIAAAIRAD
jgi:gluconate kinase